MNDTTIPQQSQMTPAQSKAALGNATALQDLLLPKAPQTPQDAPQQAETSLRDKYPKNEKTNELGQIKQGIEEIKLELEQLLSEDKNEENGQEPTQESTVEA